MNNRYENAGPSGWNKENAALPAAQQEQMAPLPTKPGVLAVLDDAAACGPSIHCTNQRTGEIHSHELREARATVERLAEAAEAFLGGAVLLSAEGKQLRAALAAFRGEA